MDLALIAAAGLMGLAGAPHCAAMCGAPCAALSRRCDAARPGAALGAFLGGRVAGYALAGAAVAAGVQAFGVLGQLAPALRPLWTAVHVGALGLGAFLLATGRLPGWLGGLCSTRVSRVDSGGWQSVAGPLRAAGAGTLWFALPCGLLQSALIVAALASTPAQGAAAMAAFALASSIGLAAYPALWSRMSANARAGRWVVRASGAALLATSGWSLGHGLWLRVAALCGLA